MANIVLKGVYATKSALDAAELEGATAGDTFLVGSKCPYDMYKFVTDAFVKQSDKVGTKGTLSITIDDVNQDIPVSELYDIPFKGADGKTLKIRRGLHLGEIHFYVPEA